MPKISKSKLIAKLKKLMKTTSRSIFRFGDDSSITTDVATNIQKIDYDVSHKKIKDTYSPPYLKIADQLSVSEDQVFHAAVFYLSKIALNDKKVAQDIVNILDKAARSDKKSKTQIDYINDKVHEIVKKHNLE